ncbi:MAG TPA: hypothetical protein VF741_09150 [Candidatus Aquilonibacter sp.]
MQLQFGRHVFGLAAIGFGICAIVWHDFNLWQQIKPFGNLPFRELLVYIVAAVEIFGGLAIQWPSTARVGAAALGILYFIFALLWLPLYVQKPLVYNQLGAFFEQISMVGGALIVYASFGGGGTRAPMLARIGYYGVAVSVVSFTLEQVFYLQDTADFIPGWIPWHMFWAVTTTVAFALAAIALLSGRFALPAARLTTLMIVLFGVLIWFPAPFGDPHSLTNWAGIAENFGIGGAVWIVADYLSRKTQLAGDVVLQHAAG